jgi:precorrin-4 methylase
VGEMVSYTLQILHRKAKGIQASAVTGVPAWVAAAARLSSPLVYPLCEFFGFIFIVW